VAATPAELLDWKAFSEKYFPGRRRHDFEALIAYAAYRRSRVVDEPNDGGEHRAALEAWEDEGGPAM
jgi:hypothetical protein